MLNCCIAFAPHCLPSVRPGTAAKPCVQRKSLSVLANFSRAYSEPSESRSCLRRKAAGYNWRSRGSQGKRLVARCASQETLELSEESVQEVLLDAKEELSQLFDQSVGITGTIQLVELDGPFVTLRLAGRFWHKRGDVLARVAAYMRRRIPDVMEVDVESKDQLDDSAENF